MKRAGAIILLFFACLCQSAAQQIAGIWKGILTMDGGCFAVNHIELILNIEANSIKGQSYHYLNTDNYVRKNIKGILDASLNKVIIQEGIVNSFEIPPNCRICIKNFELSYSRTGDQEFLTGRWTGEEMDTHFSCSAGEITLSRAAKSAFDIPEIKVDTGTIRLDFYDNGHIDGDSITVTVNRKVVLAHQKLGAKPVTTYLKMEIKDNLIEVEMVAENLGTIPPNTALLIITAGEQIYRLQLKSSKSEKARIRFVRDKDGP